MTSDQHPPHALVRSGNPSIQTCVRCGKGPKHPIHLQAHERRITRDEMFMEIIEVVRKRSTCVRGKVGAVIVQDRRIIAMGYNGAPPGAPHCSELGCDIPENDHEAGCQRTIHAEANVIAWAARHGVSVEGGTMYCTHSPCMKCAQLIVSAGLNAFVYARDYRLERLDILAQGGLEVVKFGLAGQDPQPEV